MILTKTNKESKFYYYRIEYKYNFLNGIAVKLLNWIRKHLIACIFFIFHEFITNFKIKKYSW